MSARWLLIAMLSATAACQPVVEGVVKLAIVGAEQLGPPRPNPAGDVWVAGNETRRDWVANTTAGRAWQACVTTEARELEHARSTETQRRETCMAERAGDLEQAVALAPDLRVAFLGKSPDCLDPSNPMNEVVPASTDVRHTERTWQLVRQAAAALAIDDCATVATLDALVATADVRMHTVLDSDPAIRACELRGARTQAADRAACMTLRAARLRDAAKLTDLDLRTKVLRAVPACDRATETLTDTPHVPAPARQQAGALTMTAAVEARAGSCSHYDSLEQQVASLDREYHDVAFVRHPALAGCRCEARVLGSRTRSTSDEPAAR